MRTEQGKPETQREERDRKQREARYRQQALATWRYVPPVDLQPKKDD